MNWRNAAVTLGLLCMACAATPARSFTLASREVAEGDTLPIEYTGFGEGATLPLEWSGAPAATAGYALIMHHVASPTDIHRYWVLYDIPAVVESLPRNVTGVGKLGNNSVNGRMEFTPPHSQGPGPKVYTLTLYALSHEPVISVADSLVSRAVLIDAMRGITLDSAMLHVVYSRPVAMPSIPNTDFLFGPR
jgi:phosphatidylethanolamine-binding protein (PEBP) family uncharacterized protein